VLRAVAGGGFILTGLLRTVTSKAISATARLAAESALLAAVPHAPGLAGLVGELAKEVVGALFEVTSETQKLVTALVREPMRSGLQLLLDALRHPVRNEGERGSRDALLDQSYELLVKAHNLAEASRDDALLIGAIQCVALAARSGRASLALVKLADVKKELPGLDKQAAALGASSEEYARASRLQRPQPLGPAHMELRIAENLGRAALGETGSRLSGEAEAVRERCAMIAAISDFAESAARANVDPRVDESVA